MSVTSQASAAADKLCHRAAWTLYYQRGAVGKEAEAVALIQEGLDQYASHVRLHTLYARVQCLRGDYRGAMRGVEQALVLCQPPGPSLPAPRRWEGRIENMVDKCDAEDEACVEQLRGNDAGEGAESTEQSDEKWCEWTAAAFVRQHDTDGPGLTSPEDREFCAFKNVTYVLERCPPSYCGGRVCPLPLPFMLLRTLYQCRYALSGTIERGEEYLQACVRVGDFKTAQQLANTLARQTNAKKHRMWGVAALLGQLCPPPPPLYSTVITARRQEGRSDLDRPSPTHHPLPVFDGSGVNPTNPSSSSSSLQLQIASKMLDKLLPTAAQVAARTSSSSSPADWEEEGAQRVGTPAMAQAFLDVLRQQGLYAEAVEYISSPRGGLIGFPDRRLEVLCRTLLTLCSDPTKSAIVERSEKGPGSSSSFSGSPVPATKDQWIAARLANVLGKELWCRQPDHWVAFELYVAALQCVIAMNGVNVEREPNEEEEEEGTCTSAKTLVEDLLVYNVGPRKSVGIVMPSAASASTTGSTETRFHVEESDRSWDRALELARALQSKSEGVVTNEQGSVSNALNNNNDNNKKNKNKNPHNTTSNKSNSETLEEEVSGGLSGGNTRCPRGPFLAELRLLQLQLQVIEETKKLSVQAALDDAVVSYAKRFFRLPCCYLDVSTFLTPRAATRIFQWATTGAEEDKNGAEKFNSVRGEQQPVYVTHLLISDDREESLEDHTRYILGLRCYIAMWQFGVKNEEESQSQHNEDQDDTLMHNISNNNNNNNSENTGCAVTLSFTPSIEEMQCLIKQVCVPRFNASAERFSAHLPWSEEGLTDGYLLCAANIALYAIATCEQHQKQQYHTNAEGRSDHDDGGVSPPAEFAGEDEDRHLPSSAGGEVGVADYQGQIKTLRVRASNLVAEVLDALQTAPRADNNPAFLLFRVTFAGLLRVCDSTAVQKLSLLSVQHDTMSHVGFWASLPGLPLSTTGSGSGDSGGTAASEGATLQSWCVGAEQYYRLLMKDCGDARVKVLQHFNWPVMRSIDSFRERQLHSLNRLLHTSWCAVADLLSCQTKQNVVEVCGRRRAMLMGSWREVCQHEHEHVPAQAEILSPSKADTASGNERGVSRPPAVLWSGLVDNTDWLVIRSILLADVHGAKAKRLSQTLFPRMPTNPNGHLCGEWGLPLLRSLLLLCDMARANEVEEAKKKRKLTAASRGGAAGGGRRKAQQKAGKKNNPSTAETSPEAGGLDSQQSRRRVECLLSDLFVSPCLRCSHHQMHRVCGSVGQGFLPILHETGVAEAVASWLRRGQCTAEEAITAMRAAGFTELTDVTETELVTHFGFSAKKAAATAVMVVVVDAEGTPLRDEGHGRSGEPSSQRQSIQDLRVFLDHYVSATSSAAVFESLLLPSVVVFVSLLHVCKAFGDNGVLPVSSWATAVTEAMEKALSHYQRGVWHVSGVQCGDGGDSMTADQNRWSHVSRLQAEKHGRLTRFLQDIIVDSRAISRF